MEVPRTEIQDRLGKAIWYSMIKASNLNCECEVCKVWRKIAGEFTKEVEV